jgi:dTDP-4-dehydrorhamnose 3,5-epimerase
MKLRPLSIQDIMILEPIVFSDNRGFFMETFRDRFFRKNVADVTFVQDNHSRSSQGILRGLHYQVKQSQGKLVRVVSGEVFDVAVDIRKYSPTFGRWVGETLSQDNKKLMWIPPGFAHGFYVLSPEAEFIYKCTDYYAPEHERSIKWNDPDINIDWPITPDRPPLLSEKDEKGSSFQDAEVYE